MDFTIKTEAATNPNTDCLILPIFEEVKLPKTTAKFDKISGNYISKLIKSGDLSAKVGQALLLHKVPGIKSPRILLVGCGKEAELNDKIFRDVIQKISTSLSNAAISSAICYINELSIPKRDYAWKIQQATFILANSLYQFKKYKSKTNLKPSKKADLKTLTWVISNTSDKAKAERACKIGMLLGRASHLTKDLANTPPNVCNPAFLAKTAQDLSKTYKSIKTTVLGRKALQSLKMGAFLAVAQGSNQEPKLISLEYRGASKNKPPIVFVGKGITFDSGGNSLKPPTAMIGMKFDMCGAATVLGLLQFAAELGLPLNIVGIIAAAENMPGASASRPDDIVTTMSGLTVEILNTDAEGRLVLCDALSYCRRFKPAVVIDIATLTGACVVALGNFYSGLFSNNQELANDLINAGLSSGDKCWQLPLGDEYQKLLDSNCADLANVGSQEGASIVAACFLSRFTKDYHWAHLDIAGTACRFTGKDRGATGQPLPLLAEYLLKNCN